MPRVPDEILPILTRFHREVLLPDVQRIVGESERRIKDELRSEIHTAFDGLAQRIDRLEVEYQMIVAGLKRVEERLDGVERRLDRMALRSEVQDLKARVEVLERRIAELDAQL